MLADAQNLGDKNKNPSGTFAPDWDPAFLKDIHGLILVSGDSHITISKEIKHIEHLFCMHGEHASIHKVISIVGDVRPGKEKGHEQSVSPSLPLPLPSCVPSPTPNKL